MPSLEELSFSIHEANMNIGVLKDKITQQDIRIKKLQDEVQKLKKEEQFEEWKE